MVDPHEEALLRAVLVPCESKEDLRNWIKFYLGLDFPTQVVDSESTTCPLDALWELYDALRQNNRPDMQRVMWYAARASYKTLAASVIETLAMLHLKRVVGHLAAVESQALNSQKYLKDAFKRPYLRDYLIGDSVEKTVVRWYENQLTGETITEKEFKSLLDKQNWRVHEYQDQIIVCTIRGTNSYHCNLLIIDEVDIAPPGPYEEAAHIPDEINGIRPVTLLISTRKSRFGLVQKELDEAQRSGLYVQHWNVFEITQACPPERHRPEEPTVPLYVADELLRHITESDFLSLPLGEKSKYQKIEGFAGCEKCPLFFGCKGSLSKQKSDSGFLKSINFVIEKFKEVSVPNAQAQLLCRLPATTGLVYPHFNPVVHLLTAGQMAEKITGQPYPEDFSKSQLIDLMKENGLNFYAGMDYGFTHLYAVVSGATWGQNLFVFDVIAQGGLDPVEKIDHTERIKLWDPVIFADNEAPDSIKLFKKKNFKMRDWKKTAGSVKLGIDIVRMKLFPIMGPPQLYILKGDPQCTLLAEHLSKYHFTFDAAGKPTDIPSEDNDDIPDALRYLCLNLFTPKGKVTAAPEERAQGASRLTDPPPIGAVPTTENYLNYYIQQNLSEGPSTAVASDPSSKRGRKGRLYWSLD